MPPRRTRPPQLRAPAQPDDLRHAAYAAAPVTRRRALRAQVQADCRDLPGVYRMLGATGLVLYVGKAKRLRTRLLSYFRAARKGGRRDRQARIIRHAHTLEWEYAPNEFAALLRELRLIKQHRPRFNVLMNVDEPPRGWLMLTHGPVPALRVVQRTDDPEAAALYGPFRRLSMLLEAARGLADATGIRDCALPPTQMPPAAPVTLRRARRTRPAGEAPRAPGCLRVELGSCPGPCVAPRDVPWAQADAYAARVQEVRDFLAGRSSRPIATLRAAMHAAADAWHFERAGSLKARIDALEWLAGRLVRFHAGADRLSFVYRAAGHDGTDRLYLLRRGTVRAELAPPASDAEQAALDALIARVYDGPDSKGADIPTHDLDEFYLVASWFRRHPAELDRVTPMVPRER
jgi:excinuclease UvrABC nuclease subunit